ncbi:glycoside hydrolase family 18 protein [Dentipellis sp. KUC8613]|nr:glycoside hydrolase family 18 protein [Dentipellis sp. KUC8613]
MQFFVLASLLGLTGGALAAFDMNKNTNLAVYWGQNTGGNQQQLSAYCQDDTVDTIMMGFMNVFKGPGNQPSFDFSNICSPGNSSFDGTNLPNCGYMAPDIQTCQSKGKIVTLSLGGGGKVEQVGFDSADDATSFADLIWNEFLGGSSDTRPFGKVVLDGIDLDIETQGQDFYDVFVNRIRSNAKGNSKQFFITGAPQCILPDGHLNTALLNSDLDAIYVQFYNNKQCALDNKSGFNMAAWDNFAKTKSHNKNIKVYIGAPSSTNAAGIGFVDANTLSGIITSSQKSFSSMGGVMLFDITDATRNGNFQNGVKASLTGNSKRALDDESRPRVRSRHFRLD